MNNVQSPTKPSITLVVIESGKAKHYSLKSKSQWTMGRQVPDCKPDIPLHSEIAGRRHGEFILVDGMLFYSDGGSLNGTFLNGKKLLRGMGGIAAPVFINDGDVLQIDSDRFADPRKVRIEISIK